MLTSGSTGSPKAVELSNFQIICSVMGKSQMHKTNVKSRFLNCKSKKKFQSPLFVDPAIFRKTKLTIVIIRDKI